MSITDIENLSLAEIKQLQRVLENRLVERQKMEQIELVNKIRDLIEESGFEYRDFISLLHHELGKKIVKYQHPDNESLTWAGRGRWPFWLKELVESGVGKSIEDFRVAE